MGYCLVFMLFKLSFLKIIFILRSEFESFLNGKLGIFNFNLLNFVLDFYIVFLFLCYSELNDTVIFYKFCR